MIALTMVVIALSVGAFALCAHIDFLHMKEDEVTNHLLEQHTEIMHHITNYMETLEQRIKKLEEEVKKGENDGRMDKR